MTTDHEGKYEGDRNSTNQHRGLNRQAETQMGAGKRDGQGVELLAQAAGTSEKKASEPPLWSG